MTRRRNRRRRRTVSSTRSIGGYKPRAKAEPMEVKLVCPACKWRDPGTVKLDGRVFGCPRCGTRVFGWDGTPVYLHGGQRGLEVGSYLLPPDVTKAKGTIREQAVRMGLATDGVSRGDRVYMTTRWEAAVLYAALHPSLGQVYVVTPEGELEEDPDCNEGGISYQAPKALITRAVDLHPREVMAAIKTMEHYGVAFGHQAEETDDGQGQADGPAAEVPAKLTAEGPTHQGEARPGPGDGGQAG